MGVPLQGHASISHDHTAHDSQPGVFLPQVGLRVLMASRYSDLIKIFPLSGAKMQMCVYNLHRLLLHRSRSLLIPFILLLGGRNRLFPGMHGQCHGDNAVGHKHPEILADHRISEELLARQR